MFFVPTTSWVINPSTCCHQEGTINKGIMAEVAKALGPRIRNAHNTRMEDGAKADQLEMRKVSGIRHQNSNMSATDIASL